MFESIALARIKGRGRTGSTARMLIVAGLLGSLLTVIAPSPSSGQAETTTILTVGDSICHGAIGDRPWRFNLQQHLATSGVTGVDFVGDYSQGYDGDVDPDRPTYPETNVAWDTDTSCQWGRPAFYEQATIAERVRSTNPDYLLMMLGTNDLVILRNPINASFYGKLAINNALDADPDLKMVVGGVPPSGWFGTIEEEIGATEPETEIEYGSLVRDYNNQLRDHIALLQFDPNYQGRVVFVDTFAGPWTVGDDTYDGTHPSPAGYDKIAEQFASGLSQFGLGRAVYTSPSVEPSPRPAAPMNLEAFAGPESATLRWTPSNEGNGYRVFQSVDGGPFQLVRFDLPRTKSSETMELLDPDKTYRYYLQSEYAVQVDAFDPDNPGAVRPVTIDNVGPRSNIVEVRAYRPQALTPVTNLRAQPGVDSVYLTWDPVPGVRDYRVYRSVNNGPFEAIRWDFTEPSMLAPARGATNSYRFQVEVSIGTRVSSRAQTDPIRPLPRPERPVPPELLRSGLGAGVFWQEVPGAVGYELQRKDDAGGAWTTVYFGTDLSNIQRPLVAGVTYSYRVRASLPFFYKTRWSRPSELSILAGRPPEPPKNLKGWAELTSVGLDWEHSAMADEYQVQMSSSRTGPYRTVSFNSGLSSRYIYNLEPDTEYFFRVRSFSSRVGRLATTAPIRLKTDSLPTGVRCWAPTVRELYEPERYRLESDISTYRVESLQVPDDRCVNRGLGLLRHERGKEYTVTLAAGPFAYVQEERVWVKRSDLLPVAPVLNPQTCPADELTARPGSVFGMKVRGDRARVVDENCKVIGYLDKGYEIDYRNIGNQVRGGYIEKRAGLGPEGWVQLSDLVELRPDALDGPTGSWGFCFDAGGDAAFGVSVQSCYFMNRDEEVVNTTSQAVTGGLQAGLSGAVTWAKSEISNLEAHAGPAVCGNIDFVYTVGVRVASCWSLWDRYQTTYFGVAFGADFSVAAAYSDTETRPVTNELERRFVKQEICSLGATTIYRETPPFC
jgi:lysophospholipase L1-like esterase